MSASTKGWPDLLSAGGMISRRPAGGSARLAKTASLACATHSHLRAFWIPPHHFFMVVGAGSVCPHLRGAPPRQADACLRPRTTNLRTDRTGDACAE